MTHSRALFASVAVLALGACSQSQSGSATQASAAQPAAKPATTAQTASPDQAQPTAGSGGLSLQAVNAAKFSPGSTDAPPATSGGAAEDNETDGYDNTTGGGGSEAEAASPTLIKAEVLLDRANFAPGVIDGRMGENVQHALIAYDQAHGLAPSGQLDQATWNSLTSVDGAPVLKTYTITAQDTAGPWSPDVGENFVKMSQQSSMGYHSAQEMLAERFHMDQDLLKALNPGADFSKAGTQITVVDPGQASLPRVASLDVNKNKAQVIAYDADHKVVAVFPATVGSTERPSPKGAFKVKGVAQNPDYEYDPSKLTWGPKRAGKLHIPPGPNGPVGVVWIALTAKDYGIHGTPDPHTIGKTASHGCVRLTNWDAEELSKAVHPGVSVTFVSQRG